MAKPIAPTAGDTAVKKDWTAWYLLTLLFLIALIVFAALALVVLRPNATDNLLIIGIFVGLVATTTAPALIGLLQTAAARADIKNVHELVNHGAAVDKEQSVDLGYMKGLMEGARLEAKRAADAAEALVNINNASKAQQLDTLAPQIAANTAAREAHEHTQAQVTPPVIVAPAGEPVQAETLRVVAPIAIEVVAPTVPAAGTAGIAKG